jgi:hypothetical protein
MLSFYAHRHRVLLEDFYLPLLEHKSHPLGKTALNLYVKLVLQQSPRPFIFDIDFYHIVGRLGASCLVSGTAILNRVDRSDPLKAQKPLKYLRSDRARLMCALLTMGDRSPTSGLSLMSPAMCETSKSPMK